MAKIGLLSKFFLTLLIAGAIFLFSPRAVLAATIAITSSPASVARLEEFDVSFSGQELEANSEYYLKARIGKEGQTPTKGETYNSSTSQWLYDSSSWVDFPTATTDGSGNLSNTVKARAKESAEEGTNNLTVRLQKVGSSINLDSSVVEIEIITSSTPTPQLTPTPAPEATPTSPPTTATYKINEVKDGNGNVLSSVKVYVDDVYLHHYAPESLTFCGGCQCDGYVSCDFSQHTIKLEKSGFENWSETKTINSGDFYEVSPVMNVSASDSSTSTATPTSLPKKTPTPTPTPKKLVKKKKATSTPNFILGQKEEPTPTATEEVEEGEVKGETRRGKFLPLFLLFLGLGLLAVAAYWLWYNFANDKLSLNFLKKKPARSPTNDEENSSLD